MEPKLPDWEISKLYSQSFQIVKKFRLLWILGLAGAGGGFSFSNFRSFDFNNLFNQPHHQDLPQKASQVLGAATSSPFLESLKSMVTAIPFYFYVVLGVELLLLIIIGAIISVVYSAWTQGMLIQATDTASEDKNPTLADTSQKVMPRLGSLIWLNLVPGLLLMLIFVVGFTIVGLGLALGATAIKVIFGILGVVGLGAFIYWLIMFSLIQIWAPRLVVLDGKFGKEAFFSGLKLVRKKFWPMALLGVVNTLTTGIIMILIIAAFFVAVFVLILIGTLLGKTIPILIPIMAIIGLIIFLTFLVGFALLSGMTNSFKATVWTLAYKSIRGKYD